MCHPTLDMVVSAHDDGKLRFYDSKTGEPSWRARKIHIV